MPISYVGVAGNNGGTSITVTLPSHAAGDLFFAYTIDSVTKPAGWTTLYSSYYRQIAYKFATSSSDTSGSWTSPSNTAVIIAVYRGVSTLIASGASAGGSNFGVWTYPALTPNKTDSTSWVVTMGTAVATAGTGQSTPPSGMTFRKVQSFGGGGFGPINLHDTNGTTNSWAGGTVAGAPDVHYGVSFELTAAIPGSALFWAFP